MTDKLSPEQVAEINARWIKSDLVREVMTTGEKQALTDIAVLLASHASLVAELKSRESEAMNFAKYVIDDFQRTGSVGPLAVLYASFRTPPSGN